MPDVTIIKLKIRRGTNEQRQSVVLEQGELGYATDIKRVFVGDGITAGGIRVSNIFHSPIESYTNLINQENAVTNDFIYAGTEIYQLTGSYFGHLSGWVRVSNNLNPDETSLNFNNDVKLQIRDRGITGTKFADSAAYGGIVATSTGLSANIDTTLKVQNNQIGVNVINHTNISEISFGKGIKGGYSTTTGESQIEIDADPTYFGSSSDMLTITNIPDSVVNVASFNNDVLGDGFTIDGNTIKTNVINVDNDTLFNDTGIIKLRPIHMSPGNNYFKTLDYNTFGQITSAAATITGVLSCNVSSSSLLSVFNGMPTQIENNTPLTQQTQFTVVSSNGLAVMLSSAGFVTFEGTEAQDGSEISRFAIPVFTY
jgi:hypothetical protein